MSGKKRAAEDEGECEGKVWNREEGYRLFELYSVVINEIEGDHIHGEIRSGYHVGPGQLIYSGDEGKIGVPLLLCGPEKPLFAYGDFELLFCLGKAATHQVKFEPWFFCWFPFGDTHFNEVITEEVKTEGFGKATITYEVISSAMESYAHVRFVGIGDNNDKYPTRVYGEIIAYHGDFEGTDRLLYQTSKENAHPLKDGGFLPLLRSAIAAPLKHMLSIQADLWACYDDPTSDPVLTSFIADFRVSPRPGEGYLVFDDRVKVSLTWKEPQFLLRNL